jgi:hypothetical protein
MIWLRVVAKTCIATDVFLFELAHRDGAALPAVSRGATRCATIPRKATATCWQ